MSSQEDKIRNFITISEGEIQGIESVFSHLEERTGDFNNNASRVQMTSTATLAVLERINTMLDTSMLKVDANNTETLTQQLLNVLTDVRRSIRTEELGIMREFGFVYGAINTTNDLSKTLNEKIQSKKASILNQKSLLEKAQSGATIDRRGTGERPIPLKDRREFDKIVNDSGSDPESE
jgi:preprotein translocase subunit Sec63